MKTVIIVQARMTSTRLPGKVLKPVLGKPLLEYQIERLRRIPNVDEIVIATTTNETDRAVVDLCEKLSAAYFCGSEDDVLSRYFGAAQQYAAELIVRVTADCPLIDPEIVDKAIRFYREHWQQVDYVRLEHYPLGLDAEVFPMAVLAECCREATAPSDREHVTPFIYRQPQRYRVKRLYCELDYSHHRWTVDTPEDFSLVRKIIEALYPMNPQFGLQDILNKINEHPEWQKINAAVKQKRYGE